MTAQSHTACERCGGRGEIGGPVGQTPESFEWVTEACPDCTPEAIGEGGAMKPFCRACLAIPTHGYCNMNGCPMPHPQAERLVSANTSRSPCSSRMTSVPSFTAEQRADEPGMETEMIGSLQAQAPSVPTEGHEAAAVAITRDYADDLIEFLRGLPGETSIVFRNEIRSQRWVLDRVIAQIERFAEPVKSQGSEP